MKAACIMRPTSTIGFSIERVESGSKLLTEHIKVQEMLRFSAESSVDLQMLRFAKRHQAERPTPGRNACAQWVTLDACGF